MKNFNLHNLFIVRLITKLFSYSSSLTVRHFLGLVAKMRSNNGLAYTIKYMKATKLAITRYICGKPLYINDANVSIGKDGWPTKFRFLQKLVDSNIRVLMTLMTYSRSLVPTKAEINARVVKLNTITDPYKGKEYTIPKEFILKFLEQYKLYSSKPSYDESKHYLSVKGSPLGKASYTSNFAVGALSVSQLYNIKYIVGEYYDKIYNHWYDIKFNHRELNVPNITGKLSIVHDPELKERVIAMCDYTTQFTLRPIHDILLNKLSNLPCDRTFTQNPFHKWNNENMESYHSLDLSAATDRFPIKLQQKLLSLMFNDYHFGKHWRDLLVQRSYMFEGQEYKYSVGQPMGAYTSWAAFTLTHHLVVAWSAHLCGKENFDQYIILGDDIVIKDNKVANKYITLMSRLGVDISLNKTHVSNDTYEFAKRWIKGGREISGLSLKGVVNNINSIHVVYMNIFNYYLRNPSLRVDLLTLMGYLYNGLKLKGRFYKSNFIIKSLIDFHHAIRFSFGLSNYEELRNYFIDKIQIENYIVPNENIISLKIREILSLGMVDQAKAMVRTINRDANLYENKVSKFTYSKDYPLKFGYLNHINNLVNQLKGFSNGNYNLLDIISVIRVQSLDQILNFGRNSHQNLIVMDKLWKASFKKFIIELNKSVDEKPKMDLMAHIRSGNFLSKPYGSSLATLKPWYEELEVNLKRSASQFLIMDARAVSKVKVRDSLTYTNAWQQYFIDCTRNGKVIDFNHKV